MKPYMLRNMGNGEWRVYRRRDRVFLGVVMHSAEWAGTSTGWADKVPHESADYIHSTRAQAAETVWLKSLRARIAE